MFEQIVELALEFRIGLRRPVFALEIEDEGHQRFGDIAATVIAEVAALVRHIAEGICLANHAVSMTMQKGYVERGFGLPSTSASGFAMRRPHGHDQAR